VFVYFLLVGVHLVANVSAIDCPERLVSEMTYCMSSRILKPAHLLTYLVAVCQALL